MSHSLQAWEEAAVEAQAELAQKEIDNEIIRKAWEYLTPAQRDNTPPECMVELCREIYYGRQENETNRHEYGRKEDSQDVKYRDVLRPANSPLALTLKCRWCEMELDTYTHFSKTQRKLDEPSCHLCQGARFNYGVDNRFEMPQPEEVETVEDENGMKW